MSDPALIEQELRQFLEMEDNLAKTDRLSYLMAIVNKHFAIDKIDHTVNSYDFSEIVSHAKSLAANTQSPVQISKVEVKGTELSYVLIIEAFTNYLNKHKLLKRLPKFDYKNRR